MTDVVAPLIGDILNEDRKQNEDGRNRKILELIDRYVDLSNNVKNLTDSNRYTKAELKRKQDESAGHAKDVKLVVRLMWAAVGVSIVLFVILVVVVMKR